MSTSETREAIIKQKYIKHSLATQIVIICCGLFCKRMSFGHILQNKQTMKLRKKELIHE